MTYIYIECIITINKNLLALLNYFKGAFLKDE